jgi:hypothetical protein
MAKKHKKPEHGQEAAKAEEHQKSHRRFGHGRPPAVVEPPPEEGRAGPVPGNTDFSAPEEQAMRAGMRKDRGAPPTDGSAPPQGAGGDSEPDFSDLNEGAEAE